MQSLSYGEPVQAESIGSKAPDRESAESAQAENAGPEAVEPVPGLFIHGKVDADGKEKTVARTKQSSRKYEYSACRNCPRYQGHKYKIRRL
jgi:hypothetical protein